MKQQFNNYADFFEKAGGQWLHPKEFGECYFPVTIEEMYQHFKARYEAEQKEQNNG